MSTCARCGHPLKSGAECDDGSSAETEAFIQVECRDRELANLRSLLRSVTRRLENARELLETSTTVEGVSFKVKFNEDIDTDRLKDELDAVLEALS